MCARSGPWLTQTPYPDGCWISRRWPCIEDVQEFWVATVLLTAKLSGCGALHVMWEDLAEIRTLAVADGHQGRGVGNQIVAGVAGHGADELGVSRVFVLTFAVEFFRRHGFAEIDGQAATPEVYADCSGPMTRASPSSWILTG